jgi:hypothetical protein
MIDNIVDKKLGRCHRLGLAIRLATSIRHRAMVAPTGSASGFDFDADLLQRYALGA